MANKKESIRVEKVSESIDIPGRTERIFYVFLRQIFPKAVISYEKMSFTAKNSEGIEETTTPDYEIIRPDGKIIYIEITKERRNGTDPKERDRGIMKKAAPNLLYVVLYGDTLKKIQRKYKCYDFFKSEKKKRKDRKPSPEMKPKFIKKEGLSRLPGLS